MVEHQVGFGLVLAPDRMRDQRHGADAQHLRQREDHEAYGAGGADAGDGGLPEPRDKVQIHQEVQGLEQHADRDRHRHRDQQPCNGPLRQILHASPPLRTASLCATCASRC